MTKKTEVSGTPADSLTDVELNQVSGGVFNFGLPGYLKANRSAVGGGDVNRDGIPDAIIS